MYLLNASQIKHHVGRGLGHYLFIENFDERQLQHTSYYFRVGKYYDLSTGQGEWEHGEFAPTSGNASKLFLEIPGGGYAVVKSLESFYLTSKVMGLFGSIASQYVRSGIELVHAPFIDPLFRGKLEVGLRNRLEYPVTIQYGMDLGKVCFFDISDTYPVEIVAGSTQAARFEELGEPPVGS